MKKAIPYIVIGAALYYFWWKYNQSMTNGTKPRDMTLLETEDGNPLDPKRDPNFLVKPRLNGIPTIF